MYCYTRIQIDERKFGHLEHAVERIILPVKLTDCIPNIGLACGYCNSKYKKVNEKERIPEQKGIEEFEKDSCQENCKNACAGYLNLQKIFLAMCGGAVMRKWKSFARWTLQTILTDLSAAIIMSVIVAVKQLGKSGCFHGKDQKKISDDNDCPLPAAYPGWFLHSGRFPAYRIQPVSGFVPDTGNGRRYVAGYVFTLGSGFSEMAQIGILAGAGIVLAGIACVMLRKMEVG